MVGSRTKSGREFQTGNWKGLATVSVERVTRYCKKLTVDGGYWTTRGYANSRTGRLVDWTTCGCHRRLCVLSFRSFSGIRDRELSSPRLVQSASWQSASWRVRELSSYLDGTHLSPSVSTGGRNTVVRQVQWSAAVQTPVNYHCQLEEHPIDWSP